MNVKTYRSLAKHWELKGDFSKAAEFYGKAIKRYGFDTGEFYWALMGDKTRCEKEARKS